MKHLAQSVWESAQGPLRKFESAISDLPWLGELRDRQKAARISYPLKPDFVRSFANSGYPFMTFYEFGDLVGWCRDVSFAPDYVPGYAEDVGVVYNVWTHETKNAYDRHIILKDLTSDIVVSFEVPSLATSSWFPLRISLADQDGLYFRCDQKLVVERLDGGRPRVTSWKKIPPLAECLPRLHAMTRASGEN